jgi:hypothetical protein
MKTIRLHNGMETIVDDEWYEYLSKFHWAAQKGRHTFYAMRMERKGGKCIHIAMHRVITNAESGMVVDHINFNGLDNRKENLQVVTNSENVSKRCPEHMRIGEINESIYEPAPYTIIRRTI